MMVVDVLFLSYEDLFVYLKQCFLYFVYYFEDFEVYVGILVSYWIVEGMVMFVKYMEEFGMIVEDIG